MPDRTPIVFSLPELWLLQAKVRHEMAHAKDWENPPTSVELNDQIAEAILFCEENGSPDACLELSMADCLALDYVVPQDAKDSEGRALGKPILRKIFAARRILKGSVIRAHAEEPLDIQVDVPMMMDAWKASRKEKP